MIEFYQWATENFTSFVAVTSVIGLAASMPAAALGMLIGGMK